MVEYCWFANEVCILGGTQTFIGVMATLIVLCIFHNDNNFIHKIADQIRYDLSKANSTYILNLNKRLDIWNGIPTHLKDLVGQYTTWENLANQEDKVQLSKNRTDILAVPQVFFVEAQNEINKEERIVGRYLQRKEDDYIQLYLLIQIVFILLIDSMHFSEWIGAVSLVWLSISTIFYSSCLWYIKLNNLKPSKSDNFTRSFWRWILISAAWIGLFGLFLVLLSFVQGIYLQISIVIFVCFSFLFLIWVMWKHANLMRYNNRFVIKHSFYTLLFLCVFCVILYFLQNYSLLYDNSNPEYYKYFHAWRHNMNIVFDIRFARILYVSCITLFGLFIPISMNFLVSRYQYRKAKFKITSIYKDAEAKELQLQKDYVKLITKILENQNPR